MDSFSSASMNLPGRLAPNAMNMPTSQMRKTTHLARRPAAMAKIERRWAFMTLEWYRDIS